MLCYRGHVLSSTNSSAEKLKDKKNYSPHYYAPDFKKISWLQPRKIKEFRIQKTAAIDSTKHKFAGTYSLSETWSNGYPVFHCRETGTVAFVKDMLDAIENIPTLEKPEACVCWIIEQESQRESTTTFRLCTEIIPGLLTPPQNATWRLEGEALRILSRIPPHPLTHSLTQCKRNRRPKWSSILNCSYH